MPFAYFSWFAVHCAFVDEAVTDTKLASCDKISEFDITSLPNSLPWIILCTWRSSKATPMIMPVLLDFSCYAACLSRFLKANG